MLLFSLFFNFALGIEMNIINDTYNSLKSDDISNEYLFDALSESSNLIFNKDIRKEESGFRIYGYNEDTKVLEIFNLTNTYKMYDTLHVDFAFLIFNNDGSLKYKLYFPKVKRYPTYPDLIVVAFYGKTATKVEYYKTGEVKLREYYYKDSAGYINKSSPPVREINRKSHPH